LGVGVKSIDAAQVADAALRVLGLEDAGVDLFSPEGLAACLRRAASVLCPATRGCIVRSVLESLEGLPGCIEDTKGQLDDMLTSLVGYGDLLELSVADPGSPASRIFLGQPAFVRRDSGSCLLIGVRPDAEPLVDEHLGAAIEFDAHVRLVSYWTAERVDHQLASSGLLKLSTDQWLRPPRPTPAGDLVREFVSRLDAAMSLGGLEGVTILDPSAPVRFYRGRWRTPKKGDDGVFVARRPQAFGADLWCFAAASAGAVTRLIDLPVTVSVAPASDEAWRLQAALDAEAGHPQLFRVRGLPQTDAALLDLFSPLPSWAQRRLDAIGKPLLRSRGALLSYRIPRYELDEELEFLVDMLWMASDDPGEGIDHDS
jgi:hypothetical protein